MKMKIQGLIAAAFTPFNEDGSLNLGLVPALVEKLSQDGLKGIFVCGSNGEGPNMTTEERMKVAEAFVKAANKRLLIIVHVGHSSIAESKKLAVHAQAIGADAFSSVAAFYFKPTSVETLVHCMAEIASGAPQLPFYYYHIPILTGVGMDMIDFLKYAGNLIPNLAGIKYTSATIHEYQSCLELDNGRFDVLFGFDELLLPAPDYPLWTAAVSLSGGTPVHYMCDEANGWMPDLDDIRAKITPHTKGIVVINPNNPTGALYSDALLQGIVDLARQHGLVIFADEVYDKVLYDGHRHTALASLSTDVLTLTFNSLSKSYRSCGYRAGWMVVSGDKKPAQDYIEGLNMLSSMRLCANVPGQSAIQTALGGYQSINDLVKEGGRLRRQRDLAYELITAIPGVTCVKPHAALYLFPRLDPKVYPIKDDQQFFLEMLQETKVMLVQGTGFNWPNPDHFRVVFLPHEDELREAISRMAKFLENYRNNRAA